MNVWSEARRTAGRERVPLLAGSMQAGSPMGKSQKIGKGEIEATPHPSKKKSLSVWDLMRRIAIEPNPSNYLAKFFTFGKLQLKKTSYEKIKA